MCSWLRNMDIYFVDVILLFIVAKFYKLHSTCLCLHNKYTSTLFDSASDFLFCFNFAIHQQCRLNNNTEGAIQHGQSRETGNIWYTRRENMMNQTNKKTKQKKPTKQKNPTKIQTIKHDKPSKIKTR